MDKKTIMLGMLFGSIIGSYIPTLLGAGMLSFASIIGAAVGGAFGIWLTFRLLNK